jgi:isopropylmalate/homocitrate/citramalate synthase
MGVTQFDSTVGGLGGCPFAEQPKAAGNICTEELVLLCEEMGIDTGVDLDALIEVGRIALLPARRVDTTHLRCAP